MQVTEIPIDSMMTICVSSGLQSMEFATSAKEVYSNVIYAEPVRQGDKMLGFSGKDLELSVIVPGLEDGKVFKFPDVKIRNIKTPDSNLYHEITFPKDGVSINRRGACRVWLGAEGTMSIGLGTKPIDVVVKDISVSGIAFICDKAVAVPDGAIVHVTFKDDSVNTRFDLSAIIVRSEELEHSRVLYGCKLNQESNAIAKFVNDKQREKLRASRSAKAKPLV